MMRHRNVVMKRSVTCAIIITLLGIACMFPGQTVSAQDQFVGNVIAFDSKDPEQHPHIIRIGYTALLDVKPGDPVFLGDTIKTGADVRARIVLSDASVIIIAPNSSVLMKGHYVEREQGIRNSVLKAMKGTIRFVVTKMFKSHAAGAEMKWKESSFVIETPNAVAGIRGTDLATVIDQEDTEIVVFEGAVGVRSASSTLNGEVVLGANQVSSVKKGMKPSPPSELGAAQRDALEKATTLVNPRTAANGKNGKAAKKPAKYNDKDVARDLAAGVPLSVILDTAVESGMPIEEVIPAALDAGVNPATLVYTAVAEGYSSKDVVSAAIVHGAPLNAVVAAAIGAGADKKMVISGAADAGVPPAVIATSVSNATSPNAPVYGSTLPVGRTPTAMIPVPPVVIGGGGGGTPSTRPASPYKP
jgi:hypothetical protein